MAEEKWPNYGSTTCTFGLNAKIPDQLDYMFFTINRFKSRG